MPFYPFPDVPNEAGVPTVARNTSNSGEYDTATDSSSSTLGSPNQDAGKWGIYDSNGNLLGQTSNGDSVDVDDAGPSTYTFDYRKETTVSDFPVEEGSFASYNKVERPGTPSVTLIVTGTQEQRTAFLSDLDDACKSTDLYSVATPEQTYYSVNIESYSYSRSNAKGANAIIVDVSLKEIRTVTVTYTTAPVNSPQDTSATPQVSGGIVQPVTPSSGVMAVCHTKTGVS